MWKLTGKTPRIMWKIDSYLAAWKNTPERKPLIIKGARQIGKTRSIEWFASQNYKNVIQIYFVEQPKYKSIFEDGFEVDAILKNISYINPLLSGKSFGRLL